MTIASMTLTGAAVRYAELGYRVFPLSPRSKKPLANSNGLLEATSDTYQIERWWTEQPASNVGISCDGLIVIDVDLIENKTKPNPWLTDERARSLASAPNQRTWSGGRQFIFKQPAGKHYRNTDSDIAPNIDSRGFGGYIVAAPSFVKDAARRRTGYYEFTPGCELDVDPEYLPEPPDWLIAELDRVEAQRGDVKPSNGDDRHCSDGDKIPEGKRDSTLTKLAGTMRRKGMTREEIEAALLAVNSRCHPPLPDSDVKRIAGSVARYEPSDKASGGDSPIASPMLVNLGTVVPKSIRWLWPGRVAIGKLTTIAGEPGLGKSQLALDMSSRVTTGNPWPDDPEGFNEAGSVVLLSAEDDIEDTIVPRLKAAGADLKFITALQGIEFEHSDGKKQRCFNLEQDLPHLEAAIKAVENCRLVVVDPISSYLGKTDSHKNAELRGLLAPLGELAAKHQVAVLAITHLNKTSGAKAMHRVTGSLAFVAAARAAWLVAPDKENHKRKLLLPIKNNLAPDGGGLAFGIVDINGAPALCWEEGIVTVTADEALADDSKEKPRDREKAWLQKQLAGGPVTQAFLREQANQTGFSWASIRRAANDLSVEKFKGSFRGCWSWKLPEGAHHPPSHDQVSTFDDSSF